MAIDDLQADLKKNLDGSRVLLASPVLTPQMLGDHLMFTLWPFLERVVDEIAEHDDEITEIGEGGNEFVTAETAGLLAAPIAIAMRFAQALEKGEKIPQSEIDEARTVCTAATEALTEITAGDPDDLEPEPQ